MPEFVSDAEFAPKVREYATGPRGPRPRSDEQKAWDDAFKASMDANKPLFAQVSPEEADDARKRVLSAARLYGMAVTEGQARPGSKSGTVILGWIIRVPAKRGPRKTAKTSE